MISAGYLNLRGFPKFQHILWANQFPWLKEERQVLYILPPINIQVSLNVVKSTCSVPNTLQMVVQAPVIKGKRVSLPSESLTLIPLYAIISVLITFRPHSMC